MERASSRTMHLAMAALVFSSGTARAQDAISTRLDWSAPEGCIDGGSLAALVTELLGRPAFISESSELILRGEIARSEDGRFHAELELRATAGEIVGSRTIDSDDIDCRSLDDALSVVLSVMLNVRREEIVHLLPTPEPVAPLSEDTRWRVRLAASAALSIGLMPTPAVEPAVAIAIEADEWIGVALELALDLCDPIDVRSGRLSVTSIAARAIATVRLYGGEIDLALRAGLEIGAMWASASNFAENFTSVGTVFAIRAGLWLAIPLAGPVSLDMHADVGFVPLRPTFRAMSTDGSLHTLFEPELILASFGGGFAVRID